MRGDGRESHTPVGPVSHLAFPPLELASVTAIMAVAVALRVFRLDRWGLKGDEIFTLRDSLVAAWPFGEQVTLSTRPLLFFLNYYLIRPWAELDELTLRVLPALFGILSIPVVYWFTRRLVTARAAFFSLILLTFNPIHILRSQQARYWSLVFLLSAAYPLATYIGLKERRPSWVLTGVLLFGLAVLAHPSAALPMGGLLLWMAFAKESWVRVPRQVRIALVAAVAVIGILLVPLLMTWIDRPHPERLRGLSLFLSHLSGLSLALMIVGTAGLVWLWQEKRSLATLLVGVVAVPVCALLALSHVTAVSTAYFFATAPFLFIGAGVFLDRLATSVESRGLLVASVVLALVLGAQGPTLVSHYRDGSREDYRAAAAYLASRTTGADLVASDEARSLQHYLPDTLVMALARDAEFLAGQLEDLGGDGRLWLVVRTSRRGGFKSNKLGLGRIEKWVYSNCEIRTILGVHRLDFRQNELQIYVCTAVSEEPGGALSSSV